MQRAIPASDLLLRIANRIPREAPLKPHGGHKFGAGKYKHSFTDEQVRLIRQLYLTMSARAIATEYADQLGIESCDENAIVRVNRVCIGTTHIYVR